MESPNYRPLHLIFMVILVLAGFALYFTVFLIAPLVVLLIAYLWLLLLERSRKRRRSSASPTPEAGPSRMQREATARQVELDRTSGTTHPTPAQTTHAES